MTDEKWRSPTGHSISSDVTDKLPPKTGDFLTRGQDDVQEALDDEQKPVGYLIDNGAGSAMDKFQNYYPTAIHEAQIIERGGSITPLYKCALARQQPDVPRYDPTEKVDVEKLISEQINWYASGEPTPIDEYDKGRVDGIAQAIRNLANSGRFR